VVERDGVSGAERCECTFTERIRQLEDRAGIPPLYRGASLDNFRLPDDNPLENRQLAFVLNNVRTFVREFSPENKKPGLLLIGKPGIGKTHLAIAALRMLIARGFEGVFFDYQSLLHKIHAGYSAAAGTSERDAYRLALEAEVLLLDDLGTNRVTDWVQDIVTAIVTERCNNKRPLIATTNLPDESLDERTGEKTSELVRTLCEHVGERARSRLFEMCRVIPMPSVRDYRLLAGR
jgi:DNA replication protein DnaC